MDRTEIVEMLTFIEQLDRRPFPPGAADAWLTMFADVPYADAMQAVREHFDQPEPERLIAGGIRRRAKVIAEVRERATKRQLPPAPVTCTPAVRDAALAEMRRLIARVSGVTEHQAGRELKAHMRAARQAA